MGFLSQPISDSIYRAMGGSLTGQAVQAVYRPEVSLIRAIDQSFTSREIKNVTASVPSGADVLLWTVPAGKLYKVLGLQTSLSTGTWTTSNFRVYDAASGVFDLMTAVASQTLLRYSLNNSPFYMSPGWTLYQYLDAFSVAGTLGHMAWVETYDI